MSAYQLIHCLAEGQVADLGASVHCQLILAIEGIPEADCAISSASSTNKQPMLVRGPSQCLDSSVMLREYVNGSIAVGVPYEQFIVVSA